MSEQKPSQGRIVIYTDAVKTNWPAIVVDVYGETLDLVFFTTTGSKTALNVPFSGSPELIAGVWNWPTRV
jgi:hypothetical protein